MSIFRVYYEKRGGHVHCRMFAGPKEGALGKCGELVFRTAEFAEFRGRCEWSGQIDFKSEYDPGGNKHGESEPA